MSLLVLKYGGSSLATPSRITEAARHVVHCQDEGYRLIVVVSAMGDSTNDLLRQAFRVAEEPPIRELDMLLTAGERISMALLAMALHAHGRQAISFTGSQSGIITDTIHTRARITEVRGTRIREELERGRIVIVAGFQGVSSRREVTTLGRGGSDTTAVALAAAFGAERCDLLTDVAGVYTADPRVVPGARLIDVISYDEMAEMAGLGAEVAHVRCVEIARQHRIPLRVVSSFLGGEGTMVTDKEHLSEVPLRGISHQRGLAQVIWKGIPEGAEGLKRVVEGLAEGGVNARMVIQSRHGEGRTDLCLVCPKENLGKVLTAVDKLGGSGKGSEVASLDGLASVSVIGHGVSSNPDVMARVLAVLHGIGVEPHLVSSSPLALIALIPEGDVERVVRSLHRELLEEQPG